MRERQRPRPETIVPNYVTESAYTEDISSDATMLAMCRAALAAGILSAGDRRSEVGGRRDQAGRIARRSNWGTPVWSEDGTKAALIAGRAETTRTAGFWRWTRPPARRACWRTIMTTPGWTGPGVDALGWMKNDREIYFQSERDRLLASLHGAVRGRRAEGADFGQVGKCRGCGAFERQEPNFFLTTSEGDPGEQHFYEMSAEGGARTRLTTLAGGHSRARFAR